MKIDNTPRLVTIASGDNPNLLLSATTYPQASGGVISFDLIRPNGMLQPFSWWLLNPVTADRTVFQILFYPSDGHLCLTASSTSASSALQLGTVQPALQTQLWMLDETKKAPQLISCRGAPGTDMGFPHDIPLKDMALQLMASPDTHETGDKFIVQDVEITSKS